MFHHPPRLDYEGLTIIASQPSRFDVSQLFSGNAGNWFAQECIRPGMNRFQCDLWDVEAFNSHNRKLLEGTYGVLLLGARAQKEIGGLSTTLGEQRGSPFFVNGVPHISSYLPQDCYDIVDHEGRLNPHLNGTVVGDALVDTGDTDETEDEDKDTNAISEKSRHGRTARSNWRFWLYRDTKKIIRIVRDKGKLRLPPEPVYNIYASSAEIIAELLKYENEDLFIDIETDSALNITCFGFTFGRNNPIFVVPVIRYNYLLAYDTLGSIFNALRRAMAKNRTCAHNGSGFDFIVFPFKYRLPFGKRLTDTLVMHHRCFPEVEKSLGHGISNFTDLPYHKDEGTFEPQNELKERDLWSYNGKDIFGMRELFYAILEYAGTKKGLRDSIDQANASIYPYVTATLTGFRYRQDKVDKLLRENDRKMMHLLRMLEAAVGADLLKEIRAKGKSSMPSSSKQCVRYFHGICGYPVVGYGKPSKIDGKRKPSLSEENLLKLAFNVTNPVMDIVLAYRKIAKESAMLKFNPWPEMPGVKRTNETTTQRHDIRLKEPAV